MTISTQETKISYNGNGVTTEFAFPYRFLSNSHIVVIRVAANGVGTTLVLNTDYTLTGAGDDAGGTVTLNVAPAADQRLVIYRQVPMTQETDYVSGDSFPAETHEEALDKLTMITQQHSEALSRAVTLSIISEVEPSDFIDLILQSVVDAETAADRAEAAAEAFGEGGILAVEFGGTNADTAAGARTNLGLGSAATKNAGTGAGEVLQLAEANKLPALDASLLTGIPVPEAENPIRQVVWFETGAYASGSATIPQDDTIPQQSTDGTQFMSQAFTPTAADSIIEVEVLANLDNQSGTYAMAGALFKDATEDAIAVGRTNSYFTTGCQLLMRHREVAGSTTTRTYKFKAGTPSAVVTAFNGYTGRLMGGEMNSYIKITEYAP